MESHAEGATVVTGAAGGLGRVIVEHFSRSRPVIAVDRDRAMIKEREPTSTLDRVRWILVDICDTKSVERAIADAALEWGDPLTLVHCAAALPVRRMAVEITTEEFLRAMDVSVVGALNCTRAILPGMQAAGWGRIVCISSVMGEGGWRQRAEYAASKAALNSMCATLAVELGPSGITVNCVGPGHMRTASTATDAIPWDAIVERTALGHPITTEDVTGTVEFLVSDQAGGITGTVITVDAGYLANRLARDRPSGVGNTDRSRE